MSAMRFPSRIPQSPRGPAHALQPPVHMLSPIIRRATRLPLQTHHLQNHYSRIISTCSVGSPRISRPCPQRSSPDGLHRAMDWLQQRWLHLCKLELSHRQCGTTGGLHSQTLREFTTAARRNRSFSPSKATASAVQDAAVSPQLRRNAFPTQRRFQSEEEAIQRIFASAEAWGERIMLAGVALMLANPFLVRLRPRPVQAAPKRSSKPGAKGSSSKKDDANKEKSAQTRSDARIAEHGGAGGELDLVETACRIMITGMYISMFGWASGKVVRK
jgi:hypothetical protein